MSDYSNYSEYNEHFANPGRPVEPAPTPVPAPPARKRRRVGAVVRNAVLITVVLAGVGYTVVTVQAADRDPGAPVWRLPQAAKSKESKQPAARGLKGMLLPYGTDRYERGPDIGEFGSDAELSGREATAMRKESIKDLPRSQRRRLELLIDREDIKGMAMRSYLSVHGLTDSPVTPNTAFALDIVLSKMGNERTVRGIATVQQEFFDAMKIFRKGPEIKGHKHDAACFLPPAGSGAKLDVMVCSAYVGDVLVSATATGAKPLNQKSVAMMLSAQLDRIKNPGEAV